MARLLIGNFKGQQGLQGEKGDDGVIDSNSVIDFEDYIENTPPSASTALNNILTGKSISSLLSNIKAFLKSTLTTEKIANNFATTDPTMAAGAPTVKELKENYNELNTSLTTTINSLNNNTFITPVLSGNANSVSGGYVIIGKRVIINVAVNVTAANATTVLSGMPLQKLNNIIPLSAIYSPDGSMRSAWLTQIGNIVAYSPAAGNISISGEYLIN